MMSLQKEDVANALGTDQKVAVELAKICKLTNAVLTFAWKICCGYISASSGNTPPVPVCPAASLFPICSFLAPPPD